MTQRASITIDLGADMPSARRLLCGAKFVSVKAQQTTASRFVSAYLVLFDPQSQSHNRYAEKFSDFCAKHI